MLRNLGKCGYAHLKKFDLPHKQATLGMLLQERFFEARLRVPLDAVATSYSTSFSRGQLCKYMT
jgi:acetyl CoA:N6-hydroxylysine acetyl transferase